METSRVALIALVCVVFSGQKRISGAEVEMSVGKGEDISFSCDCVWKQGFDVVWFRNCSHENQLPPVAAPPYMVHGALPRYSFMLNNSSKTSYLQIKKVTESDQGLYYCALHGRKHKNYSNVIYYSDVYHYGTKSIWISLPGTNPPCYTVSPNTPTPCVSEWSVSWKLVLGVCAVCVLLSSLLSSICVYCLCTNTTKADVKPDHAGSDQRPSQRSDMDEDDEVCYASLQVKKLKKKKKKKKKVQHSDFSTYSEVRTERKRAAEDE
ncbi:uncharacterized protein LOC108260899 [Ictalurus punctatus]|uniref:Uncharacterized protein LOC108260899 n=1 Tax=Ictalurus punctatus TaxID=7998 RepID=A0A2D0QFL2_ICTPU|nr:uncharacterized protein LOC108260899 [Ictalurus punctatus]